MPFPPVPALVLPAYLFFIIAPLFIFLGIILSLMIFTDTKKWLVAISITLPVLIIVVISPVLEIMKLTLVSYLIGFVGGSLFFYTTLVEKRHKPKYYYGPPQIITGPLVQLGHMFQVTFESAARQLKQGDGGNCTSIDLGNGVLLIYHNPLRFKYTQMVDYSLKFTITDLASVEMTRLHFGCISELDGLATGLVILYQNIHSAPTVEGNGAESMITFIIDGITRVITINKNRKIDIPPDLESYIAFVDLTKNAK